MNIMNIQRFNPTLVRLRVSRMCSGTAVISVSIPRWFD